MLKPAKLLLIYKRVTERKTGVTPQCNYFFPYVKPRHKASAQPGLPFTPPSASSLISKKVNPCSFVLLLPPTRRLLSSLHESWLGTVGKIFLYSQFWRNHWVNGMEVSCISQTRLLPPPEGCKDNTAVSSATAGVHLFKPHTKYLITAVFSSNTANRSQNPPNSCCSPGEEHFVYLFLPLGKQKYLKANLARTRHEHT